MLDYNLKPSRGKYYRKNGVFEACSGIIPISDDRLITSVRQEHVSRVPFPGAAIRKYNRNDKNKGGGVTWEAGTRALGQLHHEAGAP